MFLAETFGLPVEDINHTERVIRALETRLERTRDGGYLRNARIYLDPTKVQTGLANFDGKLVMLRTGSMMGELSAQEIGAIKGSSSVVQLRVFESVSPTGTSQPTPKVRIVEPAYVLFFDPEQDPVDLWLPKKMVLAAGATWKDLNFRTADLTLDVTGTDSILKGLSEHEPRLNFEAKQTGLNLSKLNVDNAMAATSYEPVLLSSHIARAEAEFKLDAMDRTVTIKNWRIANSKKGKELSDWSVFIHALASDGTLELQWDHRTYRINIGQNKLMNPESPSRALLVTRDGSRLSLRGVQIAASAFADLPVELRLDLGTQGEVEWKLQRELPDVKMSRVEKRLSAFDLSIPTNQAFTWSSKDDLSALLSDDALSKLKASARSKATVIKAYQLLRSADNAQASKALDALQELMPPPNSDRNALEVFCSSRNLEKDWVVAAQYLHAYAQSIVGADGMRKWDSIATRLRDASKLTTDGDADWCMLKHAEAYATARVGISVFQGTNVLNPVSAANFLRAYNITQEVHASRILRQVTSDTSLMLHQPRFMGLGGWLHWIKHGGSIGSAEAMRHASVLDGADDTLVDMHTQGTSHGLYYTLPEGLPLVLDGKELHLAWRWKVARATHEPGGAVIDIGGRKEGPLYNHPIQVVAICADQAGAPADFRTGAKIEALHYSCAFTNADPDFKHESEKWMDDRFVVSMPCFRLESIDCTQLDGAIPAPVLDWKSIERNLAEDLRARGEIYERPEGARLAILGVIANAQYTAEGIRENATTAVGWLSHVAGVRLYYK